MNEQNSNTIIVPKTMNVPVELIPQEIMGKPFGVYMVYLTGSIKDQEEKADKLKSFIKSLK